MIQLFNIVGEKNETIRRQTELEYLTRGHRLEASLLCLPVGLSQDKEMNLFLSYTGTSSSAGV